MALGANNNINGEIVPGGGLVVDDQTLKQITRALVASTTNTASAAAAAAAAQVTANLAASNLLNTNTNVANLQTTLNGVQSAVGGLPATFVQSVTESSLVSGALTFQGSSVGQSSTTFTFTPFGVPKFQALPYTFTVGDTFLVLSSAAPGGTFTLPAASSVPAGSTIRVQNNNAIGGNTLNVLCAGADTFTDASTSYTLQPIASTQHVGGFFTSDGVSQWVTASYTF